MPTEETILDEQRKSQLDQNLRAMSEGGADNDAIMAYASDFKKKYGSPKSNAPSKTGGESGARTTPSTPTLPSGGSELGSWTTEANPLKPAEPKVQVPVAKGKPMPIQEAPSDIKLFEDGKPIRQEPKKTKLGTVIFDINELKRNVAENPIAPVPLTADQAFQEVKNLEMRASSVDNLYKGQSKIFDSKKVILTQYESELNTIKQQVEKAKAEGDIDTANRLIESAKPIINNYDKQARELRKQAIKLEYLDDRKKTLDSDMIGISENQQYTTNQWQALNSGLNTLTAGVLRAPSFVYNTMIALQNKIAKETGVPIYANPQTDGYLQQAAKYFEDNADAYSKVIEKKKEQADYSIQNLFENGEYAKAFNLISESIMESAPTTAAIALSGGMGAGALGVTLGGAAVFGSQTFEENKKKGIDDNTNYINSWVNGTLEGIFEATGTLEIVKHGARLFKKEGVKAAEETAKTIWQQVYGKVAKKMFPATSAVMEGVSEAETAFTQNYVNMISGVDTEYKKKYNDIASSDMSDEEKQDALSMLSKKHLFQGVPDAFYVGAAMGGGMGLMQPKQAYTAVNNDKKNEIKKAQETLNNLNKTLTNPLVSADAKDIIQSKADAEAERISLLTEEDDKQLRETLNKDEYEAVTNIQAKIETLENSLGAIDDKDSKALVEQQIKELEAEKKVFLDKSIDNIVSRVQEKRKELGVEFNIFEDLPKNIVSTFDRIEGNLPTDINSVQEASDYLYGKYKELKAMKGSKTRPLATPQIDAFMEQLDEDITMLENYKTEQRQSAEDTLKKNTSSTPSNYGTINRNDGKGVVNLTKEEFEAEQANMQPKADEQVTPTAEGEQVPKTKEEIDAKKADIERRKQDALKSIKQNGNRWEATIFSETGFETGISHVGGTREDVLKDIEKRFEEEELKAVEQPNLPQEKAVEGNVDLNVVQKYTTNRANKDLPQAKEIDKNIIDLESSGFVELDLADISKVQLLETRGKNSEEQAVGTVRIYFKDGTVGNYDVKFKNQPTLPQEKAVGDGQGVEALRDVESTTKALDEITKNNRDANDAILAITPSKYFGDRNKGRFGNESIADAYHDAIKNNDNPELVKAVEELLTPKTTTNEIIKPNIILSGLNSGFQPVSRDSFDPRSDYNTMDEIRQEKSFAKVITKDGKKYIIVGLFKRPIERNGEAGGRDNYSFAMAEYNDSTPSDIVSTLEQEAKGNFKNIYRNFKENETIKPISTTDQELIDLSNKATPEAIAGETIKTKTNEKNDEDGEQKRGKDGEENVTKILQSEGEDGGQQVDLKEKQVLGTDGAAQFAPIENPKVVIQGTRQGLETFESSNYDSKADGRVTDARGLKFDENGVSVQKDNKGNQIVHIKVDAIDDFNRRGNLQVSVIVPEGTNVNTKSIKEIVDAEVAKIKAKGNEDLKLGKVQQSDFAALKDAVVNELKNPSVAKSKAEVAPTVEADRAAEVERLRAEEQKELNAAIPNAETAALKDKEVGSGVVDNPALRDVESTAKALDDVVNDKNLSDQQKLMKGAEVIFPVLEPVLENMPNADKLALAELTGDKTNVIKKNKIAIEYVKAKINNLNPELVKAVESLLSKEQTKTKTKQTPSSKIDEIFEQFETVDNKSNSPSSRRDANRKMKELISSDPKIKLIFDNIKDINRQLEEQQLITKKGNCP